MFQFRLSCFFLVCLLSTGCSKIPPADEDFVSRNISNKINSQVEWRKGFIQDDQAQCFISSVISKEVTPDIAIQIALLNNPKIQAIFEEIEISRSDLIAAGLLSNPAFEIEIRYPQNHKLKTNIEYLLTSSLLDIFFIPLRKRLASTEYDQTRLRVTNEILNLAFEVRETYYELLSERQIIQHLRSNADLANILSDISSKQLEVGNVNTLQFQLAQNRTLEAELELSRSEIKTIHLTEKLNRLLGFSCDVCLLFPENLPVIDICDFDLCSLESTALEERLDLQVARLEIVRICQMLGLKDWWAYTNLKGGVAGERDPDGANLIGPGFSGEIPIFNYGQADRMRLYAQLRQAQDELAVLEIKVLAEVREAHKLLVSYFNIIKKYQDYLLPMQEKISGFSFDLYNVMGISIDRLLESKRQEIMAKQHYVESMKNYLVSKVELDRALGGYLK